LRYAGTDAALPVVSAGQRMKRAFEDAHRRVRFIDDKRPVIIEVGVERRPAGGRENRIVPPPFVPSAFSLKAHGGEPYAATRFQPEGGRHCRRANRRSSSSRLEPAHRKTLIIGVSGAPGAGLGTQPIR
jgi:hypothetical protein